MKRATRPYIFFFHTSLIWRFNCKGMAHRFIICKHCGTQIDLDSFRHNRVLTKQMQAKQLCFDCAYWLDYLSHPLPNTAVIEGKLYSFELIEHNAKVHQRRAWYQYIVHIKNKSAYAIHNPKMIAVIPNHFQKEFPTEYRFITYDAYRTIHQYMAVSCTAKGCWDRYHCFWYNKEEMEPKEPWNKVPKNHVPGDEMCEGFIDKTKMYVNP